MPEYETKMLDRRNVMKVLGVSSLAGLTGYAGVAHGDQSQNPQSAHGDEDDDNDEMLEQIPAIDIPVIDGYYDGEKVWFVHTSASTQQMADQLAEMIASPVLHIPKLDEMVDFDAVSPIYVFKNGVDRSDAEPWGGGPFGYQIDVFGSVPGDEEYTPLRQPHVVTWKEDADPRILESADELLDAEEAGNVTIQEMDVVVNAPLVDWPGGSLGGLHMSTRSSMMQNMCDMHDGSGMGGKNNSSAGSGMNNNTGMASGQCGCDNESR